MRMSFMDNDTDCLYSLVEEKVLSLMSSLLNFKKLALMQSS